MQKIVCPQGWLYYGNKCYYYNSKPMIQSHASAWCQNNASTLLIVDNRDELSFAITSFTNSTDFWV